MSVIQEILDTCIASDGYDPLRNQYSVLAHTTAELGELAEEVAIARGASYKAPGDDGVVGEAVDLIVCGVDMIYVTKPSITEEQILELVKAKCAKWLKNLEQQHTAK